ncbi:MAG: ATP-binding domain-containing protein [Bacteroidota bacterium]
MEDKWQTLRGHILKFFSYQPTSCQETLLNVLVDFLSTKSDKPLFVIRGYAGTGKTTLISALVKALKLTKTKVELMAPTGRAAKVFSSYSGVMANTIHRRIYFIFTNKDGSLKISLQKNTLKNAIFIIDEASMIPDDSLSTEMTLFPTRNLLDDLMEFVYQGENCRLIFLGDLAQLPPVGLAVSPALDGKYLNARYQITLFESAMTSVVRQEENSGILNNATQLRLKLKSKDYQPPFFNIKECPDMMNIGSGDFQDVLQQSYSECGYRNTTLICRTNKRANIFNQQIRNRILFRDDEICTGDIMMVVKNNYYWLADRKDFVANGDIIELMSIQRITENYGFRFADVRVKMVDKEEGYVTEVKIILNTLQAEGPALSKEDSNILYNAVRADYAESFPKKEIPELMRIDPFFNALQVKFAYALTCHKTQGGQWEHVFIEQGYVTPDMLNREYLRWLYTALTRATQKVYLMNFKDDCFV